MRRLAAPPRELVRIELETALRANAEVRRVHRLHALLLVSIGHSCREVARWFGEDPRTVERWVHAVGQAGVAALGEHHGGGPRPRLDAETISALSRDLRSAPGTFGYRYARWSGKLLARHIARRYGVGLGLRQCQRLIRRLLTPH